MPTVPLQQAFALALQHQQAGRLADAEALYRQILAVQPRHTEALHHLGVLAGQAGRPDAAIELIRQALALSPNNPLAHYNLGTIYRARRRFDEAIASYRRALQLTPNDMEVHNSLGIALAEHGQLDEAAKAFHRALEIEPDHAEIHSNLGNILRQQGRLDEAMTSFRRALEINPNYPEAQSNLGIALASQGQFGEAMAAYRRALELKPDFAEACSNLGNAHRDQGQWGEAEAAYRRGIACPVSSASAHFNLSLLLLLLGRFEEGWRGYEWRWRSAAQANDLRTFSAPLWDGKSAAGKTLLIHAEQGYGDTLQFLRYLPLVRAQSQAARVILECHPQLVPLLQQLRETGMEVVARTHSDAALPPFDLHLPLLSLPLTLQRFEPVPVSAPYLQADDGLRAQWRERLGPGEALRVGLAWAGNPVHHDDRRRSIAPGKLTPILSVPGVQFVSLQVEPRGPLPPNLAAANVSNFSSFFPNFSEPSAIIAELDLIITVDTAAAHLAGALGRPVWLLLPFVPDWRWGLEREDTPWYPTMRLFRQAVAGDWDAVLERVAAELREWPRQRVY